jgi:hypothetical protein
VAKPLTFVSHELVHFRRYYTWVDLKHFAVQSDMSDRALLAHLIALKLPLVPAFILTMEGQFAILYVGLRAWPTSSGRRLGRRFKLVLA